MVIFPSVFVNVYQAGYGTNLIGSGTNQSLETKISQILETFASGNQTSLVGTTEKHMEVLNGFHRKIIKPNGGFQ
jgi:hypothetical protein